MLSYKSVIAIACLRGGWSAGSSEDSSRRGFRGITALVLLIGAFAALAVLAGSAHALAVGPPLPDGRAYEQVSPLDKAGSSVSGQLGLVHASPDGNRFAFYTTPTLPGSVSAQDFGTYLSTRSNEGWSTIGLLPPANLGREAALLGWTDDLAESYSKIEDPESGTYSFYARDSGTLATTLLVAGATPYVVASSDHNSGLLFEASSPLLPGGTGEFNVYLREKSTGDLALLSVFNNGETSLAGSSAGPYAWQPNPNTDPGIRGGAYMPGVLSPNAENAYFTSATADHQLYLRRNASQTQSQFVGEEGCTEPAAACTVHVSRSQRAVPDPAGPKPAAFLSASWGSDPAVFFLSSEKLTDEATTGSGDEGLDLYRYDVESKELTDLVPDPTDPNGAEVQGTLGASSDGSRIYFVANGVLGDGKSEGASLGDCKQPPSGQPSERSGECNLYLWNGEEESIHFIARLNANGPFNQGPKPLSDEMDWASQRREINRTARVSNDGRTVVFRSRNKLTGYEAEGVAEYYRYEEGQPGLNCVTCVPSGAPPLSGVLFSGPTESTVESSTAPERKTTFVPRNLSADGKRFFFETGDRLVPEDVNGVEECPEVHQRSFTVPQCQDVYEWEALGEGSCKSTAQDGGCIYLISTGRSGQPSFFGDADESGKNVFFYTIDQLVTQDKDQLIDIYDARENGGLPDQNANPMSPCADSEMCRGPTGQPPAELRPGSTSYRKPPKRHPRKCGNRAKRVKRHGKSICVPKKAQSGNRQGSKKKAGGSK